MKYCEALEIVKKAGIKLSDFKTIIVTASKSILLNSDPDPLDDSLKVYIKGKAPIIPQPVQEIEELPVKGKTKK